MHLFGGIYWVAGVVAGVSVWIWRRGGCRHPNPHYIRQETRRNEQGEDIVVQPAQYCCYECGKTWPATQRDPAWSPTAIVQKFRGYDERKALKGAKRMVVEERRRRVLAARRVQPAEPIAAPIQFKTGQTLRRAQPSEVVSLSSRKPA